MKTLFMHQSASPLFFTLVLLAILICSRQTLQADSAVELAADQAPTVIEKQELDVPKDFLETPPEYFETDAEQLIDVHDAVDVSRLHSKLVALLWGAPRLPDTLPTIFEEAIDDARYEDIASLQKIDRLTVQMEFGLNSFVYLFSPTLSNGRFVLYHQGHRGDFIVSKNQLAQFLDAGYAVAAFSMPLLGMNNQPIVELPRFGRLKLTHHDQLKLLSPPSGHPIKYFIEPVVVVINYLREKDDNAPISMVGISGGGWTTTLAAAIDPRIKKSFPVAGSYPIYLRSNSKRDWGDYEQTAPEIYSAVNYLELYVLGAHGLGRKQLQIINQFDACCFAGLKWETYVEVVRSRAFNLGAGEFDLFLDDSHQEHMISPIAMKRIIAELDNRDEH